jgi:hypothetical protein
MGVLGWLRSVRSNTLLSPALLVRLQIGSAGNSERQLQIRGAEQGQRHNRHSAYQDRDGRNTGDQPLNSKWGVHFDVSLPNVLTKGQQGNDDEKGHGREQEDHCARKGKPTADRRGNHQLPETKDGQSQQRKIKNPNARIVLALSSGLQRGRGCRVASFFLR